MGAFHVYWCISFLVLLLLAFWLGNSRDRGILGILIDGRGRYSLTHFQTVLWTIVILSSLLGVFFSQGFSLPEGALSPEILGLMGISASSAVLASGVKANKDRAAPARVARVGTFKLRDGTTTRTINASFAQIWLEEEGDLADQVISITKYQNFIFTLIIVCVFIAMTWNSGTLPKLPQNIVWLIGISHAGYVGAKVPDKA